MEESVLEPKLQRFGWFGVPSKVVIVSNEDLRDEDDDIEETTEEDGGGCLN